MARQSMHNRRAGRGSTGGGASWISYSDMMAALLLIFVLILFYSLYQYFTMLETKSRELEDQRLILVAQQDELKEKENTLIIIRADLDAKQAELDEANATLKNREEELNSLQIILAEKEKELDGIQLILTEKEAALADAQARLAEQQDALAAQARRIDDLIGVRSNIIRDLSVSLSAADLKATVDPNTGDIVLDSAVFFETARSEIRQEGKDLLDRFIPVYLNVLLSEDYRDYLGEIIIEGHTDSAGEYIPNLRLSQNRALAVAIYCLGIVNGSQRTMLQDILTAKGRSSSDLVFNADGSENKDASRRVEFKFSLRDAEMINEMNAILQGSGDSDAPTVELTQGGEE